ncbi:class I SAM-dependent methyltransferase [Halospeciosus flavus]|uniref:tRNA(Phe) (4-demethylwyosine(37)-C(7)) aminocarboxypropyltransferase n=1 Tax=Halospeciosus flavus TaxID=3032283 RepID=A0ABD5Z7N4_9EURY|nr:class I SAM-dependent methyltransferase family protein [Halospeciosus flavus]
MPSGNAGDEDRPLAVVVPKPDAEAAIDALETEGVYDASRKVVEHDADTVALPVSSRPETVDVRDTIHQTDPETRAPSLDDFLRERGWSDDEVERAPSSWAVVGDVLLVDPGDAPRPEEVGEALLDLHGEADTVLERHGIAGEHREPDVRVLAGTGDTETVHVEHGTSYALDLSRVMFSPGNKAERARMGEVVDAGEAVLDMFAGIGYFALPMARGGARVTAVEKNPTSVGYLRENARLNDVADRLDARLGDCREVAPTVDVDRVMMGYYDATERAYLDAALAAVRSGGVLHVHTACPETLLWDRPESRLADAADAAEREIEVQARRVVKSHSEGVQHVVLDVRVE